MAGALLRDPGTVSATFGIPGLGLALAFFIAAVDVASVCILVLTGGRPGDKAGSAPSGVGNGPEDIERVEE
jgi:hypothetical protein